MNMVRLGLLGIFSGASILGAVPITVLIKNETNQSATLEVAIEYSLMRGISGIKTSSVLTKEIEKTSEMNVIDWLISPESRSGRTLSIQKLTIKVNNVPVAVGDYPAIRIIIFKDGDTVTTRVERLSIFTAARFATAYWFVGMKASWSSFWNKIFGSKRIVK